MKVWRQGLPPRRTVRAADGNRRMGPGSRLEGVREKNPRESKVGWNAGESGRLTNYTLPEPYVPRNQWQLKKSPSLYVLGNGLQQKPALSACDLEKAPGCPQVCL